LKIQENLQLQKLLPKPLPPVIGLDANKRRSARKLGCTSHVYDLTYDRVPLSSIILPRDIDKSIEKKSGDRNDISVLLASSRRIPYLPMIQEYISDTDATSVLHCTNSNETSVQVTPLHTVREGKEDELEEQEEGKGSQNFQEIDLPDLITVSMG
jgi:hypothetical protein